MKTEAPNVVSDTVSNSRDLAPPIEMWGLLALGSVFMSITMCGCGHLSWLSLIVTLPSVYHGMSVYKRRRSGKISRMFTTAAFTLIVFLLVKNVADILYFGHEPLLH